MDPRVSASHPMWNALYMQHQMPHPSQYPMLALQQQPQQQPLQLVAYSQQQQQQEQQQQQQQSQQQQPQHLQYYSPYHHQQQYLPPHMPLHMYHAMMQWQPAQAYQLAQSSEAQTATAMAMQAQTEASKPKQKVKVAKAPKSQVQEQQQQNGTQQQQQQQEQPNHEGPTEPNLESQSKVKRGRGRPSHTKPPHLSSTQEQQSINALQGQQQQQHLSSTPQEAQQQTDAMAQSAPSMQLAQQDQSMSQQQIQQQPQPAPQMQSSSQSQSQSRSKRNIQKPPRLQDDEQSQQQGQPVQQYLDDYDDSGLNEFDDEFGEGEDYFDDDDDEYGEGGAKRKKKGPTGAASAASSSTGGAVDSVSSGGRNSKSGAKKEALQEDERERMKIHAQIELAERRGYDKLVQNEMNDSYAFCDSNPHTMVLSRDSLLIKLDLMDILNNGVLSFFTESQLEYLRNLLPECDRTTAGLNSTFSHPFFMQSMYEYQELLTTGSLDPDMREMRNVVSARRRRESQDLWKKKNFERYWGEQYSHRYSSKPEDKSSKMKGTSTVYWKPKAMKADLHERRGMEQLLLRCIQGDDIFAFRRRKMLLMKAGNWPLPTVEELKKQREAGLVAAVDSARSGYFDSGAAKARARKEKKEAIADHAANTTQKGDPAAASGVPNEEALDNALFASLAEKKNGNKRTSSQAAATTDFDEHDFDEEDYEVDEPMVPEKKEEPIYLEWDDDDEDDEYLNEDGTENKKKRAKMARLKKEKEKKKKLLAAAGGVAKESKPPRVTKPRAPKQSKASASSEPKSKKQKVVNQSQQPQPMDDIASASNPEVPSTAAASSSSSLPAASTSVTASAPAATTLRTLPPPAQAWLASASQVSPEMRQSLGLRPIAQVPLHLMQQQYTQPQPQQPTPDSPTTYYNAVTTAAALATGSD